MRAPTFVALSLSLSAACASEPTGSAGLYSFTGEADESDESQAGDESQGNPSSEAGVTSEDGEADTASESDETDSSGDGDTNGDGDDTTDGSGAESASTGDGDDDDEACIEETIQGSVVPWNVMLVLDYSSSMQNSVGLFGPSRWSILWDAVDYLCANYDSQINMGALLFPDMSVTTNNSCETAIVEVPVAPMNGSTIMSTIPPASDDPPGNTPTRAGIQVAAEHLASLPDQSVPQAIVLVTDGEALCPEGMWAELSDDSVDDLVGSLHAAGLPTFVIGMSDLSSSAQSQLNEIAVAGGVPNTGGPQSYYSANDLSQLQAAFDSISSQVLSCIVELEVPPQDPSFLEIEVDGSAYGYVDDCSVGAGWTFVPGSNNNQIELCQSACSTFQGGGVLDIFQACPDPG
jgi:hypothetical protein